MVMPKNTQPITYQTLMGKCIQKTFTEMDRYLENEKSCYRDWWRKWDKDYIPALEHVIQSYDTAFLKKETADYSAITTWGVFFPDQTSSQPLSLMFSPDTTSTSML